MAVLMRKPSSCQGRAHAEADAINRAQSGRPVPRPAGSRWATRDPRRRANRRLRYPAGVSTSSAPAAAPVQFPARPLVPDARLLVVVLHYKTPELAVSCLRALAPEVAALGRTEVVVVDNDSGPEAVAHIAAAIAREGWSGWAWVLALPTNGGYAAGNNVGLRLGLARGGALRYFHLLNPDTEVRPGALAALVEFMDAHPRAAIAGSQLLDADGAVQRTAYRFFSLPSELEKGFRLGVLTRLLSRWETSPPLPAGPAPCDWVCGASLIVRREALDRIGLMDEGFFLYYEETDFCRRARAAGLEVWYVPTSQVVHHAGASTGVTGAGRVLKRAPDYWFRSRRRYYTQNHGRLYAAAADWALLTGLATWRVRRRLQGFEECDPPGLVTDLLRHALHLPAGRETPACAPERPPPANQNPPGVGLLGLVREDLRAHGGEPLAPGFLALLAHRLGNARLDLPRPARPPLTLAWRALKGAVERGWGIRIDPATRVGRRVRLAHPGGMVLAAAEIGDDVEVRHLVTLGNLHDRRRRPVIEPRADLGVGATVQGQVRVGHDALVGANALVLVDVPPGAVAGGVPARVLRQRTPDELAAAQAAPQT
mgnify:CR=1 FL=1